MIWTRRRFLLAAGVLSPVAALAREVAAVGPEPAAFEPAFRYDEPAYLVGDPYLAGVDGPGLGGRSFADAREHALRFRTPASERDRHALGLELDDA